MLCLRFTQTREPSASGQDSTDGPSRWNNLLKSIRKSSRFHLLNLWPDCGVINSTVAKKRSGIKFRVKVMCVASTCLSWIPSTRLVRDKSYYWTCPAIDGSFIWAFMFLFCSLSWNNHLFTHPFVLNLVWSLLILLTLASLFALDTDSDVRPIKFF